MRPRAQCGGGEHAEERILAEVRAFAQNVVSHVRQERLHERQQCAALGAAVRGGHTRLPPDDQQPRTGADGHE